MTDDVVIIQCAITGAQDAHGRNPNLPCTPEEIADSAIEAAVAGAAAVHIHARRDDGERSASFEDFERIVTRVRASGVDTVLNL